MALNTEKSTLLAGLSWCLIGLKTSFLLREPAESWMAMYWLLCRNLVESHVYLESWCLIAQDCKGTTKVTKVEKPIETGTRARH